MQVSLREGSDVGKPVVVSEPESPAGKALRDLAREVAARTKTKVGKTLPLTVAVSQAAANPSKFVPQLRQLWG